MTRGVRLTPVDEDAARCAFCGAPVPDDDWFALEVARPTTNHDGDVGRFSDYLDVVFCAQEHAARWLDQPLPPPDPVHTSPESRWWRVVEAALVALAVVVCALAVAGGVAVIDWLRHG